MDGEHHDGRISGSDHLPLVSWSGCARTAGQRGIMVLFCRLLLALADVYTLYVACALSAVCVPMLVFYGYWKRSVAAAGPSNINAVTSSTPPASSGRGVLRELSMPFFAGKAPLGSSGPGAASTGASTGEHQPLLADTRRSATAP